MVLFTVQRMRSWRILRPGWFLPIQLVILQALNKVYEVMEAANHARDPSVMAVSSLRFPLLARTSYPQGQVCDHLRFEVVCDKHCWDYGRANTPQSSYVTFNSRSSELTHAGRVRSPLTMR